MTHLNWTKSRNRASPLFVSQINGLTVIVLVGILLYFFASALHWENPRKISVPFAERREGTVPIELSGGIKHPGIYYLPQGATVSSVFRMLRLPLPVDGPVHPANQAIIPGMVVDVQENGSFRLGQMAAAKRLALELPIDINAATLEDLILIPGVKEATAGKILAFRQAAGGRINRVEDLLQVPGIKEKRLQVLKKYLYVAARPGKTAVLPLE